MPTAPANRRLQGITAGLLALALAWIGWRACRSGFSLEQSLRALQSIDMKWFLTAAGLLLTTYLGRAYRWRWLLAGLPGPVRLLPVMAGTVIGFTAILFFGRAGELVRPWLIAQRTGTPFVAQIGAWALERILDLWMVLLLFGLAVSQIAASSARIPARFAGTIQTGGWLAALLGLACLILVLAWPVVRRLVDGSPRLGRWASDLDGAMRSIRNPTALVMIFWVSVVEWLVTVAASYCLMQAFPATSGFGWTDTIVFFGLIAFGSAVQLPGIGGGTQVTTIIVLTELFSVALEPATTFALMAWILNFALIAPFGLLWALHDGLNWKNLRNLQGSPSA
jgi:uncharacterized membrane protein YbhN (UPF0104 family)